MKARVYTRGSSEFASREGFEKSGITFVTFNPVQCALKVQGGYNTCAQVIKVFVS